MNAHTLWHAVMSRDRAADGLFVYGVTSTGVYCRPTCPSRRPNRDRVEFFPAPAMAEARGYRPCRRCHPEARTASSASPADRVRLTCEAVATRPDARWTSATLARAGGTSVVQLQRAFRRVLGLAPRDYVAACRQRRFLDAVRNGHRVTDAVYESGYGSSSRAYGAISLPGMTPATYGRGGQGAKIRWLSAESPVGRVMVASTDRGLCAVRAGAADAELLRFLRDEFPDADIAAKPSAELQPLIEAALAIARATPVPADVPVDIRGTAFQWRVWRALTKIPRGETRTYSEVARAIGRPSAVRAVAHACATNPIALVVPCHRVVRTDGHLGGYRWGLEMKDALIAAERKSRRS
ncbi:MAG TPA: methylated-DNA--[protein]-cysteine S-methyltransferase [Vicinamibacterales bacterium]|nr:methylated-DNA--[protein]-cysteine S-methyltransferase [Vicinamibacterales bacterium]